MMNPSKFCFLNSVDPDQLFSEPAEQDPHCFPLIVHVNTPLKLKSWQLIECDIQHGECLGLFKEMIKIWIL